MITAIIIDDESKGRLALREKLRLYCPEVKIVDEADNGKSGLESIIKHNPELIFLDVEMPEMNGFEMLAQWKDRRAHLIFTTAYDQYAIKAIKYGAFDYLLKPIDIEELKAAVKRVWNSELQKEPNPLPLPNKTLTRIAISTTEGLQFIPVSDIIHLEADSNYTTFYMKDGSRYLSSRHLKEYEELLRDHNFFRCHHSHMVNLEYVSRYLKNDGGQIVLSNGTSVELARRKKQEFLTRVSNHGKI